MTRQLKGTGCDENRGPDSGEGEVWRWVVGYEGYYKVSNFGRVWSVRWKRLKALMYRDDGYVDVGFCVDYKQKHPLVHVLVAQAFIGQKPKGMDVNHKDLNKSNNDWRNLEYVTRRYNCNHAIRGGHKPRKGCQAKGSDHYLSKLTEDDVRKIRQLATRKYTQDEIAEMFGVNRSNVSMIVSRVTWKHVA